VEEQKEEAVIKKPEEIRKSFHLRLMNYVKVFWDKYYSKERIRDNFKATLLILNQIAAEGKKVGAQVVFAYLPQGSEAIHWKGAPHPLYSAAWRQT